MTPAGGTATATIRSATGLPVPPLTHHRDESLMSGTLPALPTLQPLSFTLPPELEAPSPPESRGMTRDSVRMLVAHKADGTLVHSHFSELPRFLDEGDLVVLNTSGTLAAEVDGTDPDGPQVQIHLSTQLPAGLWTVEVRQGGAGVPRRRSPGPTSS